MLKSPFPYFGGKLNIARVVWRRLGDVPVYVEPFFGTGAVLLNRPESVNRRAETVNDKDGMLSNFWRAVQADPLGVAKHADWPVNENDLHARHAWLVEHQSSTDFLALLEGDPGFYNPQIAGWWVWGMCSWIGSGWCSGKGPWRVVGGRLEKVTGDPGRGVNRKLPHLGDPGQGERLAFIQGWFSALSDRLRGVRVTCGDWKRIMGPSVVWGMQRHGVRVDLTGVLLDPPFNQDIRFRGAYTHDENGIAFQAREWAVTNGDNPELRIAYCGYDEGYTWPDGWTAFSRVNNGGFANKGGEEGRGKKNALIEKVWFSPHCLFEGKE